SNPHYTPISPLSPQLSKTEESVLLPALKRLCPCPGKPGLRHEERFYAGQEQPLLSVVSAACCRNGRVQPGRTASPARLRWGGCSGSNPADAGRSRFVGRPCTNTAGRRRAWT